MSTPASPAERIANFDALIMADLFESERARYEARRHEAAFVASLVSGAGDQDAA